MKTCFYRNISCIGSLLSVSKQDSGIHKEYNIIQCIWLSPNDWLRFTCNFLNPPIVLKKLAYNSVSRGDIWDVIDVYSESQLYHLLVFMNGYQYPRYIAIIYF